MQKTNSGIVYIECAFVGLAIFSIPLALFTGAWYFIVFFVFLRTLEFKKCMKILIAITGLLSIILLLTTDITIQNLFHLNQELINNLFKNLAYKISLIQNYCLDNAIVLSIYGLFIAGILNLLDVLLFPDNLLKAKKLEKENIKLDQVETRSKTYGIKRKMNRILNSLPSSDEIGTVLGLSYKSLKKVLVPDKWLNQMILILGTTGSGKTVTIWRFFVRAIKGDFPLIVVDGKPTKENTEWLKNFAEQNNANFYGFNCENFVRYNPFATGDNTELKDKIISIKDDWSSDYYKTLAASYLQTCIEVLQSAKVSISFETLLKYMNDFNLLLDACKRNKNLIQKVNRFENVKMQDLQGLINHIETFSNATPGKYISEVNAITLEKVVKQRSVIYFALPSLQYPEFSRDMGKLVINDIKTTIFRTSQKVFCVFDEFSVFAGDQVLNLINQGRGLGIHAVLGTQGLSDLAKGSSGEEFKKQVLNNVNTIICHRIKTDVSDISEWAGTRESIETTNQVDYLTGKSDKGSIKNVNKYHIHPDNIKKLSTGEAYLMSNCEDDMIIDKIKVLYKK